MAEAVYSDTKTQDYVDNAVDGRALSSFSKFDHFLVERKSKKPSNIVGVTTDVMAQDAKELCDKIGELYRLLMGQEMGLAVPQARDVDSGSAGLIDAVRNAGEAHGEIIMSAKDAIRVMMDALCPDGLVAKKN